MAQDLIPENYYSAPAIPTNGAVDDSALIMAAAQNAQQGHGISSASQAPDVSSLVDPRKVYLAKQKGSTDGLNDIEADFASKSLSENLRKYGNQAYGINSRISEASMGDLQYSQVDRSPGRVAGDLGVGVANSFAQGLVGTAEIANRFLNPLGLVDLATGTNMTGTISKGLGSVSKGLDALADYLTSNVAKRAEEIVNVNNQLDSARHKREYDEAIARGESALTAGLARLGKDAGTAVKNYLDSPVALEQASTEVIGSVASLGVSAKALGATARGVTNLYNKLAKPKAKPNTALTRAGEEVEEYTPEYMSRARDPYYSYVDHPEELGYSRASLGAPTRAELPYRDFMSGYDRRSPIDGPRLPFQEKASTLGERVERATADAARTDAERASIFKNQGSKGELVPTVGSENALVASNKAVPAIAKEVKATSATASKASVPSTEVKALGKNTETKAAEETAKAVAETAVDNRGALEKFLTSEPFLVGAQEGGAGGLDAAKRVDQMSDEELTKSSAQYRKAKEKYLAQGYSEEEAQVKAKDEVRNRAAVMTELLQGGIAAPMGKILHKSTVYNPLGQFTDVTLNKTARETVEEAMEGLGQFGANIAAKSSYDNDRDIYEEVGNSIGSGAISAGAGTLATGMPSMARRMLGKSAVATKEAAKKAFNISKDLTEKSATSRATKNLSNMSEALMQARSQIDADIASVKTNPEVTNPDLDDIDGKVFSKEKAADTISKVANVTTATFDSDEEIANFNKELGDDLVTKGDNKLEVLQQVAKNIATRMANPDKLNTANKVSLLKNAKTIKKLYNELFSGNSIENVLEHISDEKTKKAVQSAYDSYNTLSNNSVFKQVFKQANDLAKEITDYDSDIESIQADESLTTEQKVEKINNVFEAYRHIFDNTFASKEDIARAAKFAKDAEKSGFADKGQTASFMKDVVKQAKRRAKIDAIEAEEKALNKRVAKEAGVSTDEVASFREGKSISKVAHDKLKNFFPEETNRLSFASAIALVSEHMANGEPKQAKQVLTDYMNFVQSQVNKLNAYKKSEAAYRKAKAKAGKGEKVNAKAFKYKSYDPKRRTWYYPDNGIYAGHPSLGAQMVDEIKILTHEFNALRDEFFEDDFNGELENYHPNSGEVTDDDLRQKYYNWKKKNKKAEPKYEDEDDEEIDDDSDEFEDSEEDSDDDLDEDEPKSKKSKAKNKKASKVVDDEEVDDLGSPDDLMPDSDESSDEESEEDSNSEDDLFKEKPKKKVSKEPAKKKTEDVKESEEDTESDEEDSKNKEDDLPWKTDEELEAEHKKAQEDIDSKSDDEVLDELAKEDEGDSESDDEISLEDDTVDSPDELQDDTVDTESDEDTEDDTFDPYDSNEDNTDEINEALEKNKNSKSKKSDSSSVDTNTNSETKQAKKKVVSKDQDSTDHAEVQKKRKKLKIPGMTHLSPFTKAERNTYKSGCYAGIGTRGNKGKLPKGVKEKLAKIAKSLEKQGLTLRTGEGVGSDAAFKNAVKDSSKRKVYTKYHAAKNTWGEGKTSTGPQAFKIMVHTLPDVNDHVVLKNGKLKVKNSGNDVKTTTKQLYARNCFQILGGNLKSPVDFIVCYSPLDEDGNPTPGTRYSLYLAKLMNIPVFNLAEEGAEEKFLEWMKNEYLPSKNEVLAQREADKQAAKEARLKAKEQEESEETIEEDRNEDAVTDEVDSTEDADTTSINESEDSETESAKDNSTINYNLWDMSQLEIYNKLLKDEKSLNASLSEMQKEMLSNFCLNIKERLEKAKSQSAQAKLLADLPALVKKINNPGITLSEKVKFTKDQLKTIEKWFDSELHYAMIIGPSNEHIKETIEKETNKAKEVETKSEAKASETISPKKASFMKDVATAKNKFQRNKKKLFGFKNSNFTTYEDTLAKLQNCVDGKDDSIDPEDANFLLRALNLKNKNRFFSKFTANLTQVLFPYSKNNPNAVINNEPMKFEVGEDSPFYGIHKDKGGKVVYGKVSYSDVYKLLKSDPTIINSISDSELQKLMELFPALMLLDFSSEGKIQLNMDLAANLALNSLATLSTKDNGFQYDWHRIAESVGMDLGQILRLRNDNGKPIGYKILENISSGLMLNPLIDALNRNINRSLGLKLDSEITYAASQRVAEMVATAAVNSLANSDSNGKSYIDITSYPQLNNVTVVTISKAKEKFFSTLQNPDAVNSFLKNDFVDEQGAVFIAGEDPKFAGSSHNTYENSNIKLPESARKARDNYEKVEYRIDEGMSAIYEALSSEDGNGLLRLYGEDISDPDNMDEDDYISKKGANLNITKAFEKFQLWKNQMQDAANASGVELFKARKRFRLGVTAVNRIQELESYGPISNKLTREVLLSTWNTVDINDEEIRGDIARAIIQNFGGKLNKTNFDKTKSAFETLVTAMKANPKAFSAVMELVNNPSGITSDTVLKAHDQLKAFMSENTDFKAINLDAVDKNFMGLHAMQTLAQVVKAEQEDKSKLELSIYCEADGTTNGTINANFLLSTNININQFKPSEDAGEHLIDTNDKGNMRLGDNSGKSAGYVKDGKEAKDCDVYGKSGNAAEQKIKDHIKALRNKENWGKSKASKRKGSKYTVTPADFVNAVETLFKFSGLTKNANKALEEEVTRNFMKSPCTKGMYGAGMGSIINTFLYGDRNVPGVIASLHAKRTAVLQAKAKLGEDEELTELGIAKAMFKSLKGTDKWADKQYVKALHDYCNALNIVTQNKLITSRSNEATFFTTEPVYTFGKTINSYKKGEKGKFYGHKQFTPQSFLYKTDKELADIETDEGVPVASITFSNENIESMFDAVKTIYGNDIVAAVNETIRGKNIKDTQDSLLNFSSLVTQIDNIIAAAKIANFKDDQTSVQNSRKDLSNFNDTYADESNIVNTPTTSFQVGYSERYSREELTGGSIANYQTFGRYSDTPDTHQFKFYKDRGAVKYNFLSNPGVRILPNIVISHGDGDMMQTAMNSDFLRKINYATTLIFDGGNASIGMMKKYGKLINQIQYETDLRNVLEPLVQFINDRLVVAQEQLSEKNFKNSPLGKGCQLMADAINALQEFTDKNPVMFDAMLQSAVDLWNANGKPKGYNKAVRAFLAEKREDITPEDFDGWVNSVYTNEDFDLNHFNPKVLRKKAQRQVFERICAQNRDIIDDLSSYEINSYIFSSETINNNPDIFPEGSTSLNKMNQEEYRSVINMFLGDETEKGDYLAYTTDSPITARNLADKVVANLDNCVTTMRYQSNNISNIQAAKYLMGGTYDHMASHDSPYVAKPSKEEFGNILKKFHLKPKEGETAESIWQKAMEAEDSPNATLEELRTANPDPRDFLADGENKKKRADILRGFRDVIRDNTDYDLFLKQANENTVIKSQEEKEEEPNRYIKVTSMEDYLNTRGPTSKLLNMLSSYFKNFAIEGINKSTKIAFVTGNPNIRIKDSRVNSINNLKEKYSRDMKARGKSESEINYVLNEIDRQTAEDTEVNEKFKYSRDYVHIQFYEPATNTIYVLSSNPNGLLTGDQEYRYRDIFMPHEIMHAIADKCVNYYYDKLDQVFKKDGSFNAKYANRIAKEKLDGKSIRLQRESYAYRAVYRLSQLKQQIDSFSDELLNSIRKYNPQLDSYLATRKDASLSDAKKFQEFIACFGSMTDERIQELTDVFKAENSDLFNQLHKETKEDANALVAFIKAVKNAFTDFIAAIFGLKKSDPTIRDILQGNLAIINSVSADSVAESRANDSNTHYERASVGENTQQASFMKDIHDEGDDSHTEIHAETASVDLGPSESKLSSIEDLSNAVTKVLSDRLNDIIEAGTNLDTFTSDGDLVDREYINKEKFVEATLDKKRVDTITDIIRPLQNLGFDVGNVKAFSNVVNALSLVKGMKSPLSTEITLAAKKVLDNISYEDFCDDINNPVQQMRADAILDFLTGIGANGLTTEQIAPVIFALSQTDANFKQILSKIPLKDTRNTDGFLLADKWFNSLLDKVMGYFDSLRGLPHSKDLAGQFDLLAKRMLHDEHTFNRITLIENAVDKVENAINATFSSLTRKALRKVGVPDNVTFSNTATYLENGLNNNGLVPHFMNEFVHDVIGRTKENYKFYTANTKAKVTVQQTRENAKEKLPVLIKSHLRNVTDKQWKSFTRTIGQTGLVSLFDGYSTSALTSLVKSQDKLNSSIKSLEKAVHSPYQIAKCKQLANYMMTGEAGKMLLRNPVAIAKSLGSKKAINAPTKDAIRNCDQLSSLYALQHLSGKERNELASLLSQNPEGMKRLLNTAKNQYQKGMKKALNSNKGANNWIKGTTLHRFDNAAHFKVAPLHEQQELKRMGYKFLKAYSGSNLDNAKLGIYYTSFDHTNYLNPGALQMTASTANGINLTSGTSLAPNGGVVADPKDVARITDNIGRYSAKEGEDLIPLFDENGDITSYERTISPKLLGNPKYLKPTTDYAQLLGIQEGRDIEENLVSKFNHGIVNLLKEQYDEAVNAGTSKDYVDVFAETDPVVANVVQSMPRGLRNYIVDTFGGNHFYVLRSEVNDVIGYHSASITDSWTGESRLPEPVQKLIVNSCELFMGHRAFALLKQFENGERALVNYAKNSLIVRSVVVPATNYLANNIQLLVEGVSPVAIAKYTPVVIKELNQYIKLNTKLLELRQDLAGESNGYGKNKIHAEMDIIKKSMDNLSISYLLKQKEFAAIADLSNMQGFDFSKGTIGDQIIDYLDSKGKNELVRSFTHYGMVSSDTGLYKFLEKSNQYGDFIGRAILYKDLVERRGWAPEQAHLRIADEFVDYVRLPGRGRDFLERAGLLWFYNFKIRMMKIAASNLREHPLRTLALTYGGMQTPLTDSLIGKLPVLNYTIGPAMLLSAFTANPWVMLLGLLF